MNRITTTAIVLSRTDYGEADRILTLLTPDNGKLHLMAKGVRRVKSKLAGGIELFSISDVTFIRGRGDIDTLVSTRLIRHFGHIIKDIDRTMLGYELIKQLNKATEDEPGSAYFELLEQTFEALDDPEIPLLIIKLWFAMQLMRLGGHAPNLHTDTQGSKLDAGQIYDFSQDDMAFARAPNYGHFKANHIKFLRLGFAGHAPRVLTAVTDSRALAEACYPLVRAIAGIDGR